MEIKIKTPSEYRFELVISCPIFHYSHDGIIGSRSWVIERSDSYAALQAWIDRSDKTDRRSDECSAYIRDRDGRTCLSDPDKIVPPKKDVVDVPF